MMLRVRSCSRIHITLIDMNASLGRVDGGVGLTLEEPYIEIQANSDIADEGPEETLERMRKAVRKVYEKEGYDSQHHPIHFKILSTYPSHVGLGWGTQCDLSAALVFSELYGLNLSVRELAEVVERGGTSGIGVAAFEHGGFIVDGGHRFKDKQGFKPSSASRVPPPPIIARYEFPSWEIVVAIPEFKGASSSHEIDIFKEFCPIDEAEIGKVCRTILMKMLPAVIEEDIVEFGEALNLLQTVGFKKVEVGLQHPSVRELMEVMRGAGAYGVGMSSFGPTVIGVCDGEGKSVKREAERFLSEKGGGRVILTTARNRGAEVGWR